MPISVSTPVKKVLNHFHLIDDCGRPLNSAVLLFGKDPQKWFLTSHVMCVEWPTEQRAKPIKDHRIYSGTLFDMADAATNFVLGKLEHWIGVRDEGVVVPSGYDIPRFVVAEAIVNGVAHRDYSNTGSLQIELFPDRLVVMSPGAPHPLTNVSILDKAHKSYPVNPLIADVLYQTGHIERLGTGLEDLFRECKKAGLPRPKIEIFPGEFRLTVFRNPRPNCSAGINGGINGGIKKALADNPGLGVSALAATLGRGRRMVERALAALKSQGEIEYRGSKKTGGYFLKGGGK